MYDLDEAVDSARFQARVSQCNGNIPLSMAIGRHRSEEVCNCSTNHRLLY